ncbi:unnamed protein product [Diamesa serratosioi]
MKTILFVCLLMALTSCTFAADAPDCKALARTDRDILETFYHPHETNCNLFYQCAEHGLVKMHCPKDLHFDREINQCGWPDSSNCVETVV